MASKSSGNILLRSWTIIILDTLRNVPIRKFKSEGASSYLTPNQITGPYHQRDVGGGNRTGYL